MNHRGSYYMTDGPHFGRRHLLLNNHSDKSAATPVVIAERTGANLAGTLRSQCRVCPAAACPIP
jgi:hypothetical protein